jgi:hypothetical protein
MVHINLFVAMWNLKYRDITRRVRRYQRSNHNPEIEEGQTIQWPKEMGEKEKQRSTKH